MPNVSSWIVTYVLNAAWLTLLIGGVFGLSAFALRRAPARARNRWWTGALLAAALCPLFALRSPVALFDAAPRYGYFAQSNATVETSTPLAPPVHVHRIAFKRLIVLTPRIADAIAIGALALSALALLWLFARFVLTQGVHRRSIGCEDPQLIALVASLSTRVGLARPPQVRIFDNVTPAVLGLLRPVLLLPESFTNVGAPPSSALRTGWESEIHAAIAHELAHITRRDYFWHLLCEVLSIPLAFHPLTYVLKRRVVQTREMACDELAASLLGGDAHYANSLVKLAESLATNPSSIALAEGLFDAGNLEARVSNLLRPRRSLRARATALGITTAALVALGCAFSLQVASQTPPAPVNAAAIHVVHLTFSAPKSDIPSDELDAFARRMQSLPDLGAHMDWQEEVNERIRDFWQQHGYFKAHAKLAVAPAGDHAYSVIATVDPGLQYRLSKLTLSGPIKAFPQSELLGEYAIRSGDIFNTEVIRRGLESVRRKYEAIGYSRYTAVPDTTFDDAHATVALSIEIDEGPRDSQ